MAALGCAGAEGTEGRAAGSAGCQREQARAALRRQLSAPLLSSSLCSFSRGCGGVCPELLLPHAVAGAICCHRLEHPCSCRRCRRIRGCAAAPGLGPLQCCLATSRPCGTVLGLLVVRNSPCSHGMNLLQPPRAPVPELERLQLAHRGLGLAAPRHPWDPHVRMG